MGRSINDRMSYRNHYMCSGEATSSYKIKVIVLKEASNIITFVDILLTILNSLPSSSYSYFLNNSNVI